LNKAIAPTEDTDTLPLGCVFDVTNDQFVFNEFSGGSGADCSATLQCYCHIDTHSPTTSPTKNPTHSPTTSPTKNPTHSPTENPTTSPTASPTTAPTVSKFYSVSISTVLTLTEDEYNDLLDELDSLGNYTTNLTLTSVITTNETVVINTDSPTISPTIWNQTCNYLEEVRLEDQCRNGYRTKEECLHLATNLGLFPNRGLVQSWQETSTSFFTEGCVHFINSAGQRFMKWNNQPAVANAAGTNVPSDVECYIDPVYTVENNYTYSGCACLCPPETEQTFSLVREGQCPLGHSFDKRIECQDIANQLGFVFDEAFTPSLYIPVGCVYDVPNQVMVYNHWNIPTPTDCSDDLICYCDIVTNSPTSYPTVEPTFGPTTAGGGIGVVSLTEAPTGAPTVVYHVQYFQNKPQGTDVSFGNSSFIFNDFQLFNNPSLAFKDGEMIIGTDGKLLFYQLNEMVAEINPNKPDITCSHTKLRPHLVDMDNDTIPEIFVGTHSGHILTYKWNATVGSYDRLRGPFDPVVVGQDTTVACADLDGDGDNDCVVGELNGNINYFENSGSRTVPVMVQRHGDPYLENGNPFHHIDIGDNSHPGLIDADNDGLLDLICGSKDGKIVVYLNDGTATSPHYTDYEVFIDPYNEEEFLGYFTKPVVIDMDGDGLQDFIVTSEVEDPNAVIIDAQEYTYIGVFSVISLITLSGMIFACRNNKKTAPLVTSRHVPDLEALKIAEEAATQRRPIPILGNNTASGKLRFSALKRR